MQFLAILLAFYLAAASAIHFGGREPVVDDPHMSLMEEIAHERAADLAAAELGDVWLEPGGAPEKPAVF